MSLAIVVVFHAARFWIRQIGLFNSINIPVSTFSPSIGKEMAVGPLIEIVKDIQNIGPLKSWLLGVMCAFFFIWILLKVFKSKIESKYPGSSILCQNICYSIKAFIILTIPIFLLPKLSGVATANLTGAICITSLNYVLLLKKKPLAIVAILISLLSGYHSFSNYYGQGIEMTSTCRLAATLVMSDDGKKIHKGCWISSSASNVILRKNVLGTFTTIVIPNDQIKLMSFGVGQGAQ